MTPSVVTCRKYVANCVHSVAMWVSVTARGSIGRKVIVCRCLVSFVYMTVFATFGTVDPGINDGSTIGGTVIGTVIIGTWTGGTADSGSRAIGMLDAMGN